MLQTCHCELSQRSYLEQLRIGLDLDLFSFHDLTLYGGLSYVSINDRVTREVSFFENRELTYLWAIRMLPDGTKVEEFVTDDLPHLVTSQATRYNSHRLISMPLGFRFGKDFYKLHLGVAFGLDFNYYLPDSHDILNEEAVFTDVSLEGNG